MKSLWKLTLSSPGTGQEGRIDRFMSCMHAVVSTRNESLWRVVLASRWSRRERERKRMKIRRRAKGKGNRNPIFVNPLEVDIRNVYLWESIILAFPFPKRFCSSSCLHSYKLGQEDGRKVLWARRKARDEAHLGGVLARFWVMHDLSPLTEE